MKKLKKYLLFMFLIIASCSCLASCSCSKSDGGGTPSGGGETPAGSTSPPIINTTYYEVEVELYDDSAGSYVSSTGSNTHLKGTSPVYTISPKSSYGIQKIVINGETTHLAAVDGYIFTDHEIVITEISQNTIIDIIFEKVEFTVTPIISSEGYSSSGGATIVSASGKDIFDGGTGCDYVVTPSAGYIIYSVKINDEVYYSYTSGDERASEEMTISVDMLLENTTIKVDAYKIEELSDVLVNYHSGGFNSQGETTEYVRSGEDSLISYTIDGYIDYLVPNGTCGKILVTLKDKTNIVGYSYSLNSGMIWSTYTDVSALDSSSDEMVTYSKHDNSFSVKELSTAFRLRVYTKCDAVQVKIYNPSASNGQTRLQTADIPINSYYLVQDSFASGYKWFYSVSVDYAESNTYRPITLKTSVNPVSGKTIYSIYLDESMLNAEGGIVLISVKS